MEKELDGDQVTVSIPGVEQKYNSSDRNVEIDIEIEQQESGSYIQDVKLNVGSGLRLRNTTITSQQVDADETLSPPKSRFGQPAIPNNQKNESSESMSPRSPLMESPQYRSKVVRPKRIKKTKLLEFSLIVCITLVLSLSKTENKVEKKVMWSLELWKWCVLVLVILCGRLLSEWIMNAVVFFTENFSNKIKVLYYFDTLKTSIRIFIWLVLILITWVVLITRRSRHTHKVVNRITRGIVSTLVVAGAWILRSLLVSILTSSFLPDRSNYRVKQNLYHLNILKTLSGPPLLEGVQSTNSSPRKQLSIKSSTDQEAEEQDVEIKVVEVRTIKRGKVSAVIRRLFQAVENSFFCRDESEDSEEQDRQIDGDKLEAAYTIFNNVVAKHGHKYITKDDLLRFLHHDEVSELLMLIENGKIKKQAFIEWAVDVYKERESFTKYLNSTKTVIAQLNKFFTGLIVAVLIILWIILMGIATTEVLLFISSQLLLAVFSFGATAKSTLDSMIFVFVTHPFDVGDRCVVDGVQVLVEEVNLLTTVFLRYDNEKIYYPNAELATKAISNFYRSPDMKEYVEFDLDVSTSVDNISALNAKIRRYVEGNPQYWYQSESLMVTEIEDANKMRMTLCLYHTMNFQDYGEKSRRRSILVLELKNIFEELGVKYHILPPKIYG